MKKFVLGLAVVAGLASCDSDDDGVKTPFQGETKEYTLNEMGDSGVNGTVTFNENEDGTTTVNFDLEGTEEGNMYPANIGTAEGNDIAVGFTTIDGATGESTTDVSTLENGTSITYEELVNYDGFINVQLGVDDVETVVAQAEINEIVLTGESVSYDLAGINDSGVSGTAIFAERENGETLVTLTLEGTKEDAEYPTQIRIGAVADASDEVEITLSSVNGTTGISITNVANLDGSEEGEEVATISYEDLLAYDGYISVQNTEDIEVAQGNMGTNISEE